MSHLHVAVQVITSPSCFTISHIRPRDIPTDTSDDAVVVGPQRLTIAGDVLSGVMLPCEPCVVLRHTQVRELATSTATRHMSSLITRANMMMVQAVEHEHVMGQDDVVIERDEEEAVVEERGESEGES